MRDSTTWVIGSVKTFRLGSRKIMGKWGGNLQNIPANMRRIYIPDDGKVLIQTDQAGAEALHVAYWCRPGNYRLLFVHKVKVHSYVAGHLFEHIWPSKMREYIVDGTPLDFKGMINAPIQSLKSYPYWKTFAKVAKDSDDWPANERYYYMGKQTAHSSNYGIEKNTFRMNLLDKSEGKVVVSPAEAERFLLVYHGLFPEIRDFHMRLKRQVLDTGMMYNLFGHPYKLSNMHFEESKWKELYAWIFQSTVGMTTNIAFTRMQNFIEKEKLNWDVLVNGHDSLVSQAPPTEALDCARKQKEFLEMDFESPFDRVAYKMGSESMIGLNWGHKDETNPEGLVEVEL